MAGLPAAASRGTRPASLVGGAVGPAVTLALWIIRLSGATWASVPLRSIFGPVWIATLLLAAFGVALRLSVNRQVAAATDTRQERLWL